MAATELKGAHCVPVGIGSSAGKGAGARPRAQHRTSGKLNQNGPIQYSATNTFPLRKRQVPKSVQCGSKSGKLITAVLRGVPRLAKPVKGKCICQPLCQHYYIFNRGLYPLVSEAPYPKHCTAVLLAATALPNTSNGQRVYVIIPR